MSGAAEVHRCDVPHCDGTRLGHDLAVDFPEETARVDEGLVRLRPSKREDYVMPENLQVEHTHPTATTDTKEA